MTIHKSGRPPIYIRNGEEKRQYKQIRISKEYYENLLEITKKERRSIIQQVELIIDFYKNNKNIS
jgi:hypothetical protein